MKQDTWYCYNHRDEYPYEVWYYTPKQKQKKGRYFHSIEQAKDWVSRHKDVRIEAASWQIFALRGGLV